MNLLQQQQIELKPEIDPRIASLKTKIFALKQFGHFLEIDNAEKLQNFVERCLAIQRPEELPRVFVCSSEADFNKLLAQIQTWEVVKNGLILPKIQTIKPGNEAIRDTFFYDEDLGYFKPSNYFALINPNHKVIQQIESQASRSINIGRLRFDRLSKTPKKPNTTDPFLLGHININSRNQVLVGDKIMYPYQNENGEIIIKLVKISY